MSTTPPHKLPPWHRPVMSPLSETLTEDNDGDEISLTQDPTYLSTTKLRDEGDEAVPWEVSLPDGNYKGQRKKIFIPGDYRNETAVWKVTGTFVGFGWLVFDDMGTSAELEWDGTGWQMLGGNADKRDSDDY